MKRFLIQTIIGDGVGNTIVLPMQLNGDFMQYMKIQNRKAVPLIISFDIDSTPPSCDFVIQNQWDYFELPQGFLCIPNLTCTITTQDSSIIDIAGFVSYAPIG